MKKRAQSAGLADGPEEIAAAKDRPPNRAVSVLLALVSLAALAAYITEIVRLLTTVDDGSVVASALRVTGLPAALLIVLYIDKAARGLLVICAELHAAFQRFVDFLDRYDRSNR